MNIRRLRCFLMVAEELHFGRAAQRLGMSQPPLSMAIRQFEEELGAQLFKRTTRSVELTPAGQALVEGGQSLLAEMKQITDRVRAMASGELGRLSIGFVGIASLLGLPQWIRSFRQGSPRVTLDLREASNETLVAGLLRGRFDLAFVRGRPPDPLEYRTVQREAYWLAIPPGHPLSKQSDIPLSALDNQPLVFFPRRFEPALYDRWMSDFAAQNARPRLIQDVHSLAAELAMVEAGVGLALVTESVRHQHVSDIVFRPLRGEGPQVELHVAWHPDGDSEAAQAFLMSLPDI